jgi:hypothetical protein
VRGSVDVVLNTTNVNDFDDNDDYDNAEEEQETNPISKTGISDGF